MNRGIQLRINNKAARDGPLINSRGPNNVPGPALDADRDGYD